MVAKLDARRIERDGSGLRSNFVDLALRHEQELSLVVDESSDEPGTRDAVDVNVRTGEPLHDVTSHKECPNLSRPEAYLTSTGDATHFSVTVGAPHVSAIATQFASKEAVS